MKIIFYGRLAEAIGHEVELDAPDGCTVAELRERLAAEHPEAADRLASRRARACIDDTLVGEDAVVAGRPLEFLPPVSGG